MAQVARSIDTDWLLEFLLREWRNVSSVAAAWSTMDQESRLDYLHEWPITESYGEVLQDVLSRGTLSSAQLLRYQELLAVIDEARPAIDGLLAGG